METTTPVPEQKGALRGLLLTLGLHIAALLLVCLGSLCFGTIAKVGPISFVLGIGVLQWLYMGPALWYTRRRGWTGIHKGLWIGGAITLLLSAMCWGTALVVISRNGH